MKIERAVLREIPLRLRERFEISSGSMQDRRILLLTMEGEGVEAWSECVAAESPSYSYETTDTAWHILTEFILPHIVGRKADGPTDVLSPVDWIRGHGMAKAAVEMGAWDMAARMDGVSLAEKIGGSRRPVPVGVSIGIQHTDEELHEKVAGYVAEGYKRIKIKIKPGRDVAMLAGLREAFPDVPFMADANSAYTLADAPRLKELDALKLMMIEQPLRYDDFLEHARLQERIETPVCLDESVKSEGDLALALELGSCRIVNIKPGRVGGFATSRNIHDVMQAHGLPVWCGGMLESGIGRAHNVALATLPNFVLPGDISASRRYWAQDVVDPEFEVVDGTLAVPDGPGIGVEPDRERIEALTVRSAVFG
ncbi:MAG: o-succinylbenzoate synthase [Gemmatimonadota bacterium]|nr:o-succinylbenzoate synthase [Gemmatimonadota bacterium]MDH5758269.1 o-succinylbenzoate synthase [Gemmatimonadota bacterium]